MDPMIPMASTPYENWLHIRYRTFFLVLLLTSVVTSILTVAVLFATVKRKRNNDIKEMNQFIKTKSCSDSSQDDNDDDIENDIDIQEKPSGAGRRWTPIAELLQS